MQHKSLSLFAKGCSLEGFVSDCWQVLAFSPQACGHRERVKFVLLPPQPFIAGCVVLLMVDGAQRDREFITDLEPKASAIVRSGGDGRGSAISHK